MALRNESRTQFNNYLERQAQINAVADASEQFNVTPSVEQTLEDRIRESSGFLQRINLSGVQEQEGSKLGLDIGATIASRTNTNTTDRTTTNVATLNENNRYRCEETDFDTHITHARINAWAKAPDFQTRIRNLTTQQIARDRLMIGFNGTACAQNTDRSANPLLQDVNVGWIEKMRQHKAESVLSDIKIGQNGDYNNMDAAVFDATNELLAEWYQDDPDLIVIVGRELLADKYLAMINQHDAPSERRALDIIMTNQQLGGLPAIRVPFFPSRSLAITRLDNLSIYYQEGSRNRQIIDNPKRKRIEDYQTVNEAYVVEDYDLMCVIENILVPDSKGGWK